MVSLHWSAHPENRVITKEILDFSMGNWCDSILRPVSIVEKNLLQPSSKPEQGSRLAMGLTTRTGAEGVTDVVINVVDAKARRSESTIS